MKIRIHMLGNINLICDYDDLVWAVSDIKKAAKKGELMEIKFPNIASKFINPAHIVAIEEYIEPIAPIPENS